MGMWEGQTLRRKFLALHSLSAATSILLLTLAVLWLEDPIIRCLAGIGIVVMVSMLVRMFRV